MGTRTEGPCLPNYPQTPPLNVNAGVGVRRKILWSSYLKITLELFTRNKPAVGCICFGRCEDLLELTVGFFMVKLCNKNSSCFWEFLRACLLVRRDAVPSTCEGGCPLQVSLVFQVFKRCREDVVSFHALSSAIWRSLSPLSIPQHLKNCPQMKNQFLSLVCRCKPKWSELLCECLHIKGIRRFYFVKQRLEFKNLLLLSLLSSVIFSSCLR